MKTSKLYPIGMAAIMIFTFSHQANAQLVNFYGSPGYINTINTAYSNSLLVRDTKKNNVSSGVTQSDSSRQSSDPIIPIIPEYRRYPAVQFTSTGTRLTLQEYLDAVNISPEDKEELKELILQILNEYEAEAARKGYPNDWALALVSYAGLNSHVYYGKTEKLIIPFEQNLGLRDIVAESATDNGIFNNVSDQQKQELYELLIIGGGLVYHFYEKACRENNTEEIKNCKLAAAKNLKVIGIKVEQDD